MPETTSKSHDAPVEPVTVAAEPLKKTNNNKIIIIVALILILCCCVTVAGITAFIALNPAKSNNVPNLLDQIGTKQPKNYSLSEVKQIYMDAKNYHFEGDATFSDGSKINFKGEFVSPSDDHYITVESDGFTSEEIFVGGKYYYLDDGSNGWQEANIEDKYNSGIQRKELLYFFDNIDINTQPTKNETGQLVYEYKDSELEEQWLLSVNAENGTIEDLFLEYLDEDNKKVVETLYFSNFNDKTLKIEAPL